LLRLSAEQSSHALGLAASLAGGLAQVWLEGSGEGPLQLAFGARNGVTAARAAGFGATAAAYALEGPSGLYRAFGGATEPPCEAIAVTGHWQVEEVTLKPYPVCAILQGPVSAVLDLRAQHGVYPAALERIVVSLNPAEAAYPGVDHAGPFANAIATKMSAQFSLSLAVLTGQVTLDGLGRVRDADVLALVPRIEVRAEPAMKQRLCQVDLHLRNDQTLTACITRPLGQPSFDELSHSVRTLAGDMGATMPAVERLIAAVAGLDQAPDTRELMAAALSCQSFSQ
jgi:2-methylcitrate dehydratase PrpD